MSSRSVSLPQRPRAPLSVCPPALQGGVQCPALRAPVPRLAARVGRRSGARGRRVRAPVPRVPCSAGGQTQPQDDTLRPRALCSLRRRERCGQGRGRASVKCRRWGWALSDASTLGPISSPAQRCHVRTCQVCLHTPALADPAACAHMRVATSLSRFRPELLLVSHDSHAHLPTRRARTHAHAHAGGGESGNGFRTKE